MAGRVFYTLASAFALGICIRSLIEPPEWLWSVFLGGGIFVLVLFYARRAAILILCSAALLGCALGIFRTEWTLGTPPDMQFERALGASATLEGVVVRDVDERERTTHLTIDVDTLDGAPADERVLVYTERFPRFSYGDRVRVVAVIERPESFETDLGRTFDYPGYLSARGITYVLPFGDVEKIGEGEGNIVFTLLLSLKHAFMDRLERALPEPQAGLAEGLLLGVKRALGDDLERAFRIAGIIHIVVLSGYNITIVAEAIMRLLSRFFAPRTRALAGGAAIVCFALIAGCSATVVRASIMAVLVLIARATGRTYDVVRALVFAGVVMLIANPLLLVYDPGFQLSFLATLGLVLLAPLLEARFALVPTRFQIREFVTATIATQIFVLPLLLYSIGEFSLVALVVNVIVLPVVPLAMGLSFFAGTIGFVHATLALPFAYAAHLVLAYIVVVAEFFSSLPYAALVVPAFPFWITILAYASMAYAMYRTYQRISKTPSRGGLPPQTNSGS